jgi:hypothetical protein
MCQGHSIGHIDSAFVLLLERDVWWFLVESDAETFQFGFYYSLVGEWFVDVEDNENQITRPCDSYDLATSALKVRNDAQNVQDAYLAVFSTFDDSWQIENLMSTHKAKKVYLDLCASILEDSRHGCQGRD